MQQTEAQMMIRKPVQEVFEAFINPAATTQFWFTKSSGRMEQGRELTWEWEMYNLSVRVQVIEILLHKKITFNWGSPPRNVVFSFIPLRENATFVKVAEEGYTQTGAELIAVIKDATGGFTTVLDGLKAWLEHGINLQLIADKFPPETDSDHGSKQ
jgi:uncharacterized protein YndB with AHSA1/START domain